MSLLKFLLGSKFRKKWKHEEEQRKNAVAKVNLADPHQRRELMNCIAYSPGIPSDDDLRFVDNWEDNSLTISESSNVTIVSSENIVTVVEVHAEDEDDKQDETTLCEGLEDLEEETEENSQQELQNTNEVSEETELAVDSADGAAPEDNEVVESEELEAETADQGILVEVDCSTEENEALNLDPVAVAEPDNDTVEDLAPTEALQSETSESEATEEDVIIEISTPDGDNVKSDEDELPDQLVPELAGSDYTESTTLTPASSIEMETQTDLPPVPRETETQTDVPLPPAVSMCPGHLYQPCNPLELRLLSVALSELEADRSKPPSRVCSCSGNGQPGPNTPNLSFSAEKNREIARENANLLSRLQRTHTRIRKSSMAAGPPESSSSINRRKQQERIQRENLILLRKITAARGRGRGQNTMLSYY